MFLLLALSFLTIDPHTSSFKVQEKENVRIDRYHFTGNYEQLENIDIDASKKMRVEMELTGTFPLLKKIDYFGSFGTLDAHLTGLFPQLEVANFIASSTTMKIDLSGKWKKNCTLNFKGGRGEVELTLPKDVGITVHTHTGLKGKVVNRALEKQGKGILNKTFVNPAQLTAEIQLIVNVEMGEGKIILK